MACLFSLNVSVVNFMHLSHQAFVGDDTWEHLFPDFFDISIPYPSFDVFDLHTVDDGVWKVRS